MTYTHVQRKRKNTTKIVLKRKQAINFTMHEKRMVKFFLTANLSFFYFQILVLYSCTKSLIDGTFGNVTKVTSTEKRLVGYRKT